MYIYIYNLFFLHRSMFLHLIKHNYSGCYKLYDDFNILNISTLEFIGNLSVCVHCVFYFPRIPLTYIFTGIKQCDITVCFS